MGVIQTLLVWGPLIVAVIGLCVGSFALGRALCKRTSWHIEAPDARGWVGIGCYVLVLLVLGMIWADRTLLRDDFFKVLATAIILTGWSGGPVGWAFQATKAGGELADVNARIVQDRATADALDGPGGQPQRVTIDQRGAGAVPVREAGDGAPGASGGDFGGGEEP